MSSSRWRRWLNHLGCIVRVVVGLKTRWAPNIGSQSLKALTPNTGEEKTQRYESMRGRERLAQRPLST
jgi:hypothetical protein